jgi:hypothetical protein
MDFIRYHLLNKAKRITYTKPGIDELIFISFVKKQANSESPSFKRGIFLLILAHYNGYDILALWET